MSVRWGGQGSFVDQQGSSPGVEAPVPPKGWVFLRLRPYPPDKFWKKVASFNPQPPMTAAATVRTAPRCSAPTSFNPQPAIKMAAIRLGIWLLARLRAVSILSHQ